MRITETAIPGLLIIDLDVHGDNRGWFKENWQREKFTGLAPELASFQPVPVSYTHLTLPTNREA